MLTGATVRILLRYYAGYLVAQGFIDDETGRFLATDPDIELMVGAAVSAITEGYYTLAKRYGWPT